MSCTTTFTWPKNSPVVYGALLIKYRPIFFIMWFFLFYMVEIIQFFFKWEIIYLGKFDPTILLFAPFEKGDIYCFTVVRLSLCLSVSQSIQQVSVHFLAEITHTDKMQYTDLSQECLDQVRCSVRSVYFWQSVALCT